MIKKEDIANCMSVDVWDDNGDAAYDPRQVEWWLAEDQTTILCGDPSDPEVVCAFTGDDPMFVSNRLNGDDKTIILLASHIVNLHNRSK